MDEKERELVCESEPQTSCRREEQFLSQSYASKEDFIKEYKHFYGKTGKAKQLYLCILTKLAAAIAQGDMNNFNKLISFIDYLCESEDEAALRNYYGDVNNPVKKSNLVILACKYNRLKILKYLLCNGSNLYFRLSGTTILPDDQDEMCHNAFYYAMSSNNCELLDSLINKWPNNYFSSHPEILDKILSQDYEELKLKNVPFSEEMEVFVESKLINVRFFSNPFDRDHNIKSSDNNIRERIALVHQNINTLNAEYINTEHIDERFLFMAKFIAHNIHILKRQLKSTYDRFPWEEIEFCLVSFLSSHLKQQEINFFYKATLNKNKILRHLENFAKKLIEEPIIIKGEENRKFLNVLNLKREKVVTKIIRDCPQFEELYSDYQQIRDIYSLEKISNYIKLASSVSPNQREGQLIIIRVLQLIGEYSKNTLESPKLSSTTSELLLLSLPKNTRQVIIDLRNSLSHAYSLDKRTEIEENADTNFFIGVQNDTKKIGNVISDILYKNKIKTIRVLLKKIIEIESLYEIKEVVEILSNIKLDEKAMDSFYLLEHEKLEKLIKELNDSFNPKSNYENTLFDRIFCIINSVKLKSETIITDYNTSFTLLQILGSSLYKLKIDQYAFRGMKFFAKKILKNLSSQMESGDLKEIAELSKKICDSATSRITNENIFTETKDSSSDDQILHELHRLTWEIFYIVEFSMSSLKWIEELREKLNVKSIFDSVYKQRKAYSVTEDKYNNQLALKLSELKSIFTNSYMSKKPIAKLPLYKENKKLQAVVEMLLLDIMSILGRSDKYLENNMHFLDDNAPLLTGKCLRNHLAHENTLIDILLSDPSIAVMLNAKKLTSENIIKSKKKVGKLVKDDPSKLKDKYNKSLNIITNQKNMFAALKDGNLQDLKSCLRKGADIKARSIGLLTAMHFAAQSPSLQTIKFLIKQNLCVNIKDLKGQSPIHFAAAYGRTNIVDFLIKEEGVYVDSPDHNGKTPLHIAAENGHKTTVETLIKNNANTNIRDRSKFSPLHYAIDHNHIDVVKILLKKESNVDINELFTGYTSLHLASLKGHLELVNFLLTSGANVNARNDDGKVPLHMATLNGHVEVVNVLILNGANVNSSVIDGCTSLHFATEAGHEDITNILLKHGANANAVGKTFNNTPLHLASKDGHEEIVKALLKNSANVNIATVYGLTPLHFAAYSGHLKIAADLLKHGASINAKSKTESTPLHFAAEQGHKDVAELFIKNRADTNSKDLNNLTPLHLAALSGHRDIVELLITNNASVESKEIHGATPLHMAAVNGNKYIIDNLIKSKSKVNATMDNGMTPLYFAVLHGNEDAAAFLIENKANVHVRAEHGLTPMSAAIVKGYTNIVELLLKNYDDVNAECGFEGTPLNLAAEGGLEEIVHILIKNGANVNSKCNTVTPLLSAIKFNHKEIVEVLIKSGASVNEEGSPLLLAVVAGYRDIVEILLKNNAHVSRKYHDDFTVLHMAASRGHKEIVNALIARGAKVDAVNINKTTPLFLAAQEGHAEIIEILIASKANVNFKNIDGAPIHLAAAKGHVNVIEVLLQNGAKVHVKDSLNRTALELAISYGHLQVVKMLLEKEKVDMTAKGNDGWTKLHIAAQTNNLEMVKYLVDKGCNVKARNMCEAMPIHIAAREGFKDIVEFLLSKGSSVNEQGMNKQTVLHYATFSQEVQYLIDRGANVHAKDADGLTPLHVATYFSNKGLVEVLLQNGAIYNAIDNLNRRPINLTFDRDIINLLEWTDKLFESVKCNSISKVQHAIRAGAFINAINTARVSALHYAAWRGYKGVVKILLEHKADPNIAGKQGCTPIHYAAKYSHLKIIKALLSHGAVFEIVMDSGKTPSDFTENKDIIHLFKLIEESFRKVKEHNTEVLNDLNKVTDIDLVKAVMCARNKEKQTLVVAAELSNFPKVELLKQVSQGDVSSQIGAALVLLSQGNYERALSIFRDTLKKRKEILGPDNPGTLDIEAHISTVLYKQGAYQESLDILEKIYQKQIQLFGLNDKNTLSTRSTIALTLHRLGQNEEAFNIFQEVYEKQMEVLEPNHSDIINTQFHMALVLNEQGKCEEALSINREIFEKSKETLGEFNLFTASVQNNIALVLSNLGKYDESLKIYKEVLEKKKKLLGINHTDTLNTLSNIAGVLEKQYNYHEALKTFQEVLDIQMKTLGKNHLDISITQYNIASIFFAQGKYTSSLKLYRECFDQLKVAFGLNHPAVLNILERMKVFHFKAKIEGSQASEDIITAIRKDAIQSVQH